MISEKHVDSCEYNKLNWTEKKKKSEFLYHKGYKVQEIILIKHKSLVS